MNLHRPIQALCLTSQAGAREIEAELLSTEIKSEELCWIHLDYSQAAAQKWLNGLATLQRNPGRFKTMLL